MSAIDRDRLDRAIQFEQRSAMVIIAHHRLNPEKASDTNAPGNRLDMMEA
jgi:hypothetical protein